MLSPSEPPDGNTAGGNLNPFNVIPIEINQIIASFLDSNKDIATFNRICRSTHYAIEGDGLSFWRRRFMARFETPANFENNKQYKTAYQRRCAVLAATVKVKRGASNAERIALDVLINLILEAHNPPSTPRPFAIHPESINLAHVTKYISANPEFVTTTVQRPKPGQALRPTNPLLLTLQVMMAPHLLNPESPLKLSYRFPESQRAAYANASTEIFGHTGLQIDMLWVLHQLNFWQYHMTRECEFTLFEAHSSLSEGERPRMWSKPLLPPTNPRSINGGGGATAAAATIKLGTHWKGSYAFVSRSKVQAIRSGEGENENIQDEFSAEASGGAFQDLTLKIRGGGGGDDDDEAHAAALRDWPVVFEHHLKALRDPRGAKTRAQHHRIGIGMGEEKGRGGGKGKSRSFRFDGEGADVDEEFLADGWLNPLPDQNGVPGWLRMTMMKYFLDDNGMVDYDGLWAYEGVVLPGGEIIVGRWWSPNDGLGEGMYSGPFILWCVDERRLEGLEG